jgi:hypothetical protein
MLQKGEEKNRPWDVSSYLNLGSDLTWRYKRCYKKPTRKVFDAIMNSRMLSS